MQRHTAARVAAALLALLAPVACDSPTGPHQPVAARLDIVSGDLQTATVNTELAQPLVVRVTDGNGHPVQGQIINFRVTAGNGSVFAGAANTDVNGEARERWTLGTVAGDTQRVEARAVDSSTGAPLVFATFRAVGTAAAPNGIAPAGPASFTGFPLTPLADSVAVVVRDVYGNPVPGAAVVWTVKQGGGSVSPGTSTTGPQGVARASWTLGAPLDSLQVIEAAAGLTLKTQLTANGHVPADAVVVKVSGDAQTDTVARTLAQPLVVRVQRANGTPVPGIPVTFSSAQGGSFSPATGVSNAQGLVSVQWTLGTVATSAVATASISTGSTATFSATAVHAAPARVVVAAGTLVDHTRTAIASVLDAYGNGVPGVQVTWTPAAGNGASSPTASVTGAQGSAVTEWTLALIAGPQTLNVAAAGFAATLTDQLPTSALPIELEKVSGDNQAAAPRDSLAQPLVVRAFRGGPPAAGVEVTWRYTNSLTTDSSTVTTITTTDADGYARINFRVPFYTGRRTVTASVAGGATVQFTVTSGIAGPLARIVALGAGGQNGAAGAVLADSLVARAVDDRGVAVAGVEVTWSVELGGGSVSPTAVVTDVDGYARAAWRLGSGPGLQQARAASGGFTADFYASTGPGPAVRTDSVFYRLDPETSWFFTGTVVSTSGPGEFWFDMSTSPDMSNATRQGPYAFTDPATVTVRMDNNPYLPRYPGYVRFGARNADGVSLGEVKHAR
jgi:hypothetical protein